MRDDGEYTLEEAIDMAKRGIAMTHPTLNGVGFTCDEDGRLTYPDGIKSGIMKDVFKSDHIGWKIYKEPKTSKVETHPNIYVNHGCIVRHIITVDLYTAGTIRDAKAIAYMLRHGYLTEQDLIDTSNNVED